MGLYWTCDCGHLNADGFMGRTKCKECGLRKDKRKNPTSAPAKVEEIVPQPPAQLAAAPEPVVAKIEAPEREVTVSDILAAILQNQQMMYDKLLELEERFPQPNQEKLAKPKPKKHWKKGKKKPSEEEEE